MKDFLLKWYLTKFKGLKPNIEMLKNAIKQTCVERISLKDFNWKEQLIKKINKVDFGNIKKDLVNLIEIPQELNLINKDNFLKLLKG